MTEDKERQKMGDMPLIFVKTYTHKIIFFKEPRYAVRGTFYSAKTNSYLHY